MARRFFILANAAILILSACRNSPDNFQGAEGKMSYKSTKPAMQVSAITAPDDDASGVISNNDEAPPPPPSAPIVSPEGIPKKIIRNGNINFFVKDYKTARKDVAGVVAANGGYIVSEHEEHTESLWVTTMDVKVPSDKFDACLEGLSGTAETVNEKTVSSQDVTEEYIDVASRMKAKKEVEQRYLDILKQAKTVEDILKVEEQLKEIREEVEASQGRLQYIDHNVSMSTIHLLFSQRFSNTTPQGPGFFSRTFFSIKDGWNGLLTVLVSLISLWPVWIVAAVVFIAIRRYLKRRKLRVVPAQTN